MTQQEKKIFRFAAYEIREKGLSFTMSDLSTRAGISKKTLYEIFRKKEDVVMKLIIESHGSIREQQNILYDDHSLTAVEKIKRILTVVPEFHFAFNYTFLIELKKKYPAVYNKVNELLKFDWDRTFELMNEALNKKQIKRFNKILFKEMYCSTIMSVHDMKLLSDLNMTYEQTLTEIIDIMIEGILL